ncbi:hypothetical protein [Klebsiella michiganensis]|uniref:hypothetical protein n=1 Tax=Klebsiella michiganensis TaxID=1134687 RepID=UPI0019148503|nr:hypothetical protein [Klebsiella michiganensis]HDX8940822.1 hypothetical protein [Klebsiella michiganensis]
MQAIKKKTKYIRQQNLFRGLVSKYRSKKFKTDETGIGNINSATLFRRGLEELLLETRAKITWGEYKHFLSWVTFQINSQLKEINTIDIGYSYLAGVYNKSPSVSLEDELRWITARIVNDSEKINTFRFLANEIEKSLFSMSFDNAELILDKIDSDFGVSLWTVQLRIAIKNLNSGLETQKKYTAEVRSIYKRGLLNFIAYNTSVRNEDKTTFQNFKENILKRIDGHKYYDNEIKNYMKYKLANKWPTKIEDFAHILHIEQSHTLQDIYETFIHTIQELIKKKDELNNNLTSIISQCINKLSCIKDYRVNKIALSLQKAQGRNFNRNTNISDKIFSGRIKEAFITGVRKNSRNTIVDIWDLIYTSIACASFDSTTQLFENNQKIHLYLGGFLRKKSLSRDYYNYLYKYSVNFRTIPTALGLLEFLDQQKHISPTFDFDIWKIGLNSPTYGIEDIVNIEKENTNKNYNDEIPAGLTNEIFYTNTIRDKDSLNNIGLAIVNIFEASALYKKSEFHEAISKLKKFPNTYAYEPLNTIHELLSLSIYFALGNRDNVIRILSKSATKTENSEELSPIHETLKNYSWDDFRKVDSELCATISQHLLWKQNYNEDIETQLRNLLGRFFKINDISKPSDLVEFSQNYNTTELIYFLKNICVPYFLDSLRRILKSSQDVMNERQAICASLRLIDPTNSSNYQDEVMLITNQQAMEEGEWIVDRTRIYVDMDEFFRWAVAALSESYARYRDLMEINVNIEQDFDELIQDILDKNEMQKISYVTADESDAVILGIYSSLSEEFLNNSSFGLDFYLSKRIRHQSFIGLIRGPLEFSNIITTKSIETNDYKSNSRWLDKFSDYPFLQEKNIDSAFKKFSKQFDDLLIQAKEDKFQIKNKEHPNGLIYFSHTKEIIEMMRIIPKMISDDSIQEFLPAASAIIWASLEHSLSEARKYITNNLKTEIVLLIDELRSTIGKYAKNSCNYLEFDSQMGVVSTEVQRALDDAAKWFSRQGDLESNKKQFRLDQIVKIATKSALKCQRGFSPLINPNVSNGDLLMTTSTLVFVHDVLFVALDNAKAYSGKIDPYVNISVTPDIKNGTLRIQVISEVKSEYRNLGNKKLREIRELIQSGKLGTRSKKEGKSGFIKIAAVVKQSQKGDIHFDYNSNGEFELNVVYSLIITKIST